MSTSKPRLFSLDASARLDARRWFFSGLAVGVATKLRLGQARERHRIDHMLISGTENAGCSGANNYGAGATDTEQGVNGLAGQMPF